LNERGICDKLDSEPKSPQKQEQQSSLLGEDQFRAILLIGLAFASIVLCTEFFLTTAPAGPKIFSFSQSEAVPRTSVSISGVSGELKAYPWSQPGILINGTIAVTGSGASPVQVTLQQQVYPGTISFQPVLPNAQLSQGRTYTVDTNLYFPSTLNFSSFNLDTTTGNIQVTGVTASAISIRTTSGDIIANNLAASDIQLGSINGAVRTTNVTASTLSASSTEGTVQVELSSVKQGASYSGSSVHGTVDFYVPSASSFKLTAHSQFVGHAGFYSGFMDCQTKYTQQTLAGTVFDSTFTATCGDGSATITLSSISGDATITRG